MKKFDCNHDAKKNLHTNVAPKSTTIISHGTKRKSHDEDLHHPNPQQQQQQRHIPISLGKPSLRQRLEAYYSLISPEVVSNESDWKLKFDQIYEKYGGTMEGEAALARKLMKKYGTTVRLRLTTAQKEEQHKSTTHPNVKSQQQQERQKEEEQEREYEHWLTQRQNTGVLDFTSDFFDPFTALYTKDPHQLCQENPTFDPSLLSAPYSTVVLDNITKCLHLLPHGDPQRKEYIPSLPTPKIQKIKTPKIPILSSLSAKYESSGPFSFLSQLHAQRLRIRVLVRYIDCIRGTLTGYLLAFDKHMNMILRDVDEVYTSRVTKVFAPATLSKSEYEYQRRTCILRGDRQDVHTSHVHKTRKPTSQSFSHGIHTASILGATDGGESIAPPSLSSSTTVTPSLSTSATTPQNGVRVYQRHLHQVLVRGDTIVSVWNAEVERSAYPKTKLSPIFTDSSGQVRSSTVGTAGSLLLLLNHLDRKKER